MAIDVRTKTGTDSETVRAAAAIATLVLPGPAGEMTEYLLRLWDDWGHTLGGHMEVRRITRELLRRGEKIDAGTEPQG